MKSYLEKFVVIYLLFVTSCDHVVFGVVHRTSEKQTPQDKVNVDTRSNNDSDRLECPFYKATPQRFLEKLRYRLSSIYKNPKMAYRMAILASMGYWEFHKSADQSITGFRLRQDRYPRTSNRSRLRYQACRLKVKSKSMRNYVYDMVMNGNFPISSVFNSSKYWVSSRKICKEEKKRKPDPKKYIFQYSLYNWYEPSVPGVKFHDTDLLISNSEDQQELVIAFGGSASPADAVTNMQTFESVKHASFFGGSKYNQTELQGSIHRGIFNAYSRVVHGSILRLNPNATAAMLSSLDNKFLTANGKFPCPNGKFPHSQRSPPSFADGSKRL